MRRSLAQSLQLQRTDGRNETKDGLARSVYVTLVEFRLLAAAEEEEEEEEEEKDRRHHG